MKCRVLVVGASGFIGRRVVSALQASGWALPVATLHRSPLSSGPVQSVLVDATDRASLMRVVASADAVVNCVTGSVDAIVSTAENLLSIVSEMPHSPRMVHLSTMSVYGSLSGTVDEAAEIRGDLNAYAAAKVRAECLAARCPDVVILRPGCVYGPGGVQWSERIAELLWSRRLGDIGSAGDGYCNLVHVDDVVGAILKVLRLPGLGGEIFNLGSPNPPTWNEYFISFAKVLGAVPVRRITRRRLLLEARVLAPPLKTAQWASDATRTGLAIPPAITLSLLRLWRQEIRLDVAKAEQTLGMSWTPPQVGLRDAAALLRGSGPW